LPTATLVSTRPDRASSCATLALPVAAHTERPAPFCHGRRADGPRGLRLVAQALLPPHARGSGSSDPTALRHLEAWRARATGTRGSSPPRKERGMYIGIGTLLVILIVILIVILL
jgi:hypothetical protein